MDEAQGITLTGECLMVSTRSGPSPGLCKTYGYYDVPPLILVRSGMESRCAFGNELTEANQLDTGDRRPIMIMYRAYH